MCYLKAVKYVGASDGKFSTDWEKLQGYISGDSINHLYGLKLSHQCVPSEFERGDLVLVGVAGRKSDYERTGYLFTGGYPILVDVRDVVGNFIIDIDGREHDVHLGERFAVIERDINYHSFIAQGRIRHLAYRIRCLYGIIDDVDVYRRLGSSLTSYGVDVLVERLKDAGYRGKYLLGDICGGDVDDVRYFLIGQLLTLHRLLFREIAAYGELHDSLHKQDLEQRDYLDGLIDNINEIYGDDVVGHNDKRALQERIIKLNECTGLHVGVKGSPAGWVADSYSSSELLGIYKAKYDFVVERLKLRVAFADYFSEDKLRGDYDAVCKSFVDLHNLKFCECDKL